MDSNFTFQLRDQVRITVSGETGEVTGRAQYVNSGNSYRIRYSEAGTGRAVEQWWEGDALQSVAPSEG